MEIDTTVNIYNLPIWLPLRLFKPNNTISILKNATMKAIDENPSRNIKTDPKTQEQIWFSTAWQNICNKAYASDTLSSLSTGI